ncbi:PKD domain-containing protein [Flavobacterium sp. DSP2-3-1]|uniref:PKD domain-containing protein n=1 Tax=Flavobacterium sp. DSP2-3-1 TaxID=2804620 RepID=UPI003CEF96E6
MKNLKLILSLFVLTIFLGCSDENNDVDLAGVNAPSNISALTTIIQDNSGNVTFLPKGEGVTQFEIYFGDAITAPVYINPGATITHKYKEGKFQAKIIGVTINGKKTETIQVVTVSFLAPINFEPTITIGSNLSINVIAKAELETFFQVYFGDVSNEVPVDFMEGEVITHTYLNPGTYQVKVVALSGGVATTQKTQSVTVTNLFAAPIPTIPAANVISMFSDSYTNVAVDTWRTSWSQANLEDIDISGNKTKKYSALNFVGIEATATPINASAMTFFHIDIWSSNLTEFKVKLVDFGANGVFGGGDDKEHEITIANPVKEKWVSLDLPLSDFAGLTTRSHIAQLILVGAPSGNTTVYVDNVFFYNKAGSVTAAPIPTLAVSKVISMFSDAYTNVPVNTWRTSWSSATLTDMSINGNATKKYSALDFVGIEATTSPINATAMTHFHTDVWSSDFTQFKIKLVDFGANGAFGGGDDVEHEITILSPAKGSWVSLDIPLSSFTGLNTRAHIAQLIYVGAPAGNNTVYIDNVYFHN